MAGSAECGWVGWTTVPVGGGTPQKQLRPNIDPDILTSMGEIMVCWSLFERLLDVTTQRLLGYQNKTVTGWRKQETAKRIRLHDLEMKSVFKMHPDLLNYHQVMVVNNAWHCKKVRDSIAHRHVIDVDEDSIRFYPDVLGKKSRKTYTGLELSLIAAQVRIGAGTIDAISSADDILPVSSQCKSVLQRVLGMGHPSSAIEEVLPPRFYASAR